MLLWMVLLRGCWAGGQGSQAGCPKRVLMAQPQNPNGVGGRVREGGCPHGCWLRDIASSVAICCDTR